MTAINPLTTEQRDRLETVLAAVFDGDDLRRFATERLAFDDVKFADEVNFSQAKSRVIFDLIEVAIQHNHVTEVVRALGDARSNRPDVRVLVETMVGIDTETPADGVISAVVRESVIRFNDRFQSRQKQVKFLNAYKQLHDLLHHLQDFQGQLESLVNAIQRASDDSPDPAGVTDPLTLWVQEAKESVQKTEFPNSPPRWIARFDRAVADLSIELAKPDPAAIEVPKLNRALEILAHLPVDEQKGLNSLLVGCAMRLDTDDLVDLMDRILTELGKVRAAGKAADDLRSGVGPFRILCRGLADLIRDHTLCQEIDGALREAAGLAEVIPSALSQWPEIKESLREIATRRGGDIRADRAFASANDFEAAEQVQKPLEGDALAAARKKTARVFDRLQERFNDLFFYTDKSLLNVTQDLLVAAQTLDATLRSFFP